LQPLLKITSELAQVKTETNHRFLEQKNAHNQVVSLHDELQQDLNKLYQKIIDCQKAISKNED
jgi:uncharacterized protein YlxW (UPF0749 family)